MAALMYPPFIVTADVPGTGTVTHTVIRELFVYDASVYATGTGGGAGTVKLTNAAGADITDAMVCQVDTTVDRAALLVSTAAVVAAAGSLNFVSAAAAVGTVTAHVVLPASAIALP